MKSHFKHVVTIINPSAGSDLPILSELNNATTKYNLTNEIFVTQSETDATLFARKAVKIKPDAIIVHGGDGTILDVANVLYKYNIPLIIIPGGTANIIAKELGIPLEIAEAFKILGRKPKPVQINIASVGKDIMILRIEVGILAKMVEEASSEMKKKLGIFAYSINALKQSIAGTTSHYSLNIDGKKYTVEGVGLMIANFGNIGLPGISLQAKVKCDDDLLDIFVLKSSDIASLIALGSSALIGTEKPVDLEHWQGKKVTVSITPKQTVVIDDKIIKASRFTVQLKNEYLTVLT